MDETHSTLIASLVALAAGPVLAGILASRTRWHQALDGFVLVIVSCLCLMSLLPEAYESLGGWALLLAALGLYLPTVAERHLHHHAAGETGGFVLLAMQETTHLIYRPRRYILPGGDVVDSRGQPWSAEYDPRDEEDLFIEKVALALVDDMSIGDAINFFTIHEAPYRPYLTYCARCGMDGSLVAGDPTTVRSGGVSPSLSQQPARARPSGRLNPRKSPEESSGRFKSPFGPEGHKPRRFDDESSSESEE